MQPSEYYHLELIEIPYGLSGNFSTYWDQESEGARSLCRNWTSFQGQGTTCECGTAPQTMEHMLVCPPLDRFCIVQKLPSGCAMTSFHIHVGNMNSVMKTWFVNTRQHCTHEDLVEFNDSARFLPYVWTRKEEDWMPQWMASAFALWNVQSSGDFIGRHRAMLGTRAKFGLSKLRPASNWPQLKAAGGNGRPQKWPQHKKHQAIGQLWPRCSGCCGRPQ